MASLKMKVVRFEEDSKSLIVAFASDETASNNPENYAALAYQPIDMWPGVTNAEQLKRNIAMTGISHTTQQALREKNPASEELVTEFKSWVGQTFTFDTNDLSVPALPETPLHTI
jgi:PBP1b-binding outer membrane lipoprotein LpoB